MSIADRDTAICAGGSRVPGRDAKRSHALPAS